MRISYWKDDSNDDDDDEGMREEAEERCRIEEAKRKKEGTEEGRGE